MDSSTLLLRALSEFDTVTAVSFDYGQKHRVELERAQALVNYLNVNNQKINYRVIKLEGLVDLLNSALVTGGAEVPGGHYAAKDRVCLPCCSALVGWLVLCSDLRLLVLIVEI